MQNDLTDLLCADLLWLFYLWSGLEAQEWFLRRTVESQPAGNVMVFNDKHVDVKVQIGESPAQCYNNL